MLAAARLEAVLRDHKSVRSSGASQTPPADKSASVKLQMLLIYATFNAFHLGFLHKGVQVLISNSETAARHTEVKSEFSVVSMKDHNLATLNGH